MLVQLLLPIVQSSVALLLSPTWNITLGSCVIGEKSMHWTIDRQLKWHVTQCHVCTDLTFQKVSVYHLQCTVLTFHMEVSIIFAKRAVMVQVILVLYIQSTNCVHKRRTAERKEVRWSAHNFHTSMNVFTDEITITITILFQVKIPQCVQLTSQLRYCKKNNFLKQYSIIIQHIFESHNISQTMQILFKNDTCKVYRHT